ncbi:divalent metal cation transporter [Paenibacillus sp. GP183]|uniref:NRAMP family divalent metal transporter n=1 Tax=Paenibacillus sp. GP183 TaxID=1882751 RepID=UPI000AFDA6CA|nr:divalent metal cation transporter [Paenibacillus sp. GP183]
MQYFGISPYISVPIAVLLLIACTVAGNFRTWESFMYLFIAANFLAIPLAFMTHPTAHSVIHDFFIPHMQGGLNSNVMLLIISIIGTTVAPWQLFFQQSNVIDKRLTPRWMAYERADTIIGSFVVILGAAALIIATSFGFQGTELVGKFVDAGAVAKGLAEKISPMAGSFFAIVLLNASLIGAAAVTLSTSYAFGDVFGVKHSLHRKWSDAKGFYLSYAIFILIAGGIVLIPNAPLGLITTAVQALAGILLPSATVFLLLLCNDKDVLGPWVNKMWLNIVSSIIVGVLVMLSLILAVTTLFPNVNVTLMTEVLSCVLLVGLVTAGLLFSGKEKLNVTNEKVIIDRRMWRMPSLSSLPKPVWSKTRKFGMIVLRGYLLVAVILMIVKAVQLALGL